MEVKETMTLNGDVVSSMIHVEPQKVMLGEMTVDEYINRKVEEQFKLALQEIENKIAL